MEDRHMFRVAGIYLLLMFFSMPNMVRAQTELPKAVRQLSAERLSEILAISIPDTHDEVGPNYPLLMKGFRIDFQNPVGIFIFDNPISWLVQDAAIHSLRNYSAMNLRQQDPRMFIQKSVGDVGGDFLRRVLFDPLINHRFMPKKMGIYIDIGKVGLKDLARGGSTSTMLRFSARF